ncbi:MAG: efflux RND transporter permease subunit [Planctomycetota bacterium]|nr:efflux RND transporter permease subunit [Planctomycetota bacterium]
MFSRFFIDRPIFASVLSMVITLAGWLAVYNLPLAQYPPVTPPTVQVNCAYPGASAQVVAETVAAPIEQEVNGVEKMLYMSSQCTNDGGYSLTVTFENGVDLNLAQVLVQNRVNLALPKLPLVLRQTGVATRKRSPDILLSVNIQSPHGTYDQLYLSNYALMRLRDELLRLDGIGDIFISGQRDYSMRIWVDPEKLAVRNLTAGDVVNAIRRQNAQIASGQIGQPPVAPGQETQVTLTTIGRLKTPEQFGDVILRATIDGRIIRIKDVARVVLGARNEDIRAKVDGKATVGLIIFQLPDANALEVADRIHAKMDELAKDFPADLIYQIQYDTTPYTRDCIKEVVKALRDAILLVAFVVLLFLQNWRSAISPLVTVPVAIIGTFAIMAMMGFSLNNLTLFGLVLAIGIVVDDAIVVVEAVEYHIEHGLAPREATIKAMSQVSGPVIAVGLVLSAVFVPCAFISGITGQFFRQFALTIAGSTLISTFNSLTLSPALAALLLRPRVKGEHHVLPRLFYVLAGGWLAYQVLTPWLGSWIKDGGVFSPDLAEEMVSAAPGAAGSIGAAAGWLVGPLVNLLLGWLFGLFNRGFDVTARVYTRAVGMLLRVSVLVLVVYGGLLALTYSGFKSTPKGFIPSQDMGYLLVNVQLPDAASAERTRRITDRVQEICRAMAGVKHTVSQAGQSFLLQANASNFGSMFVILDDFSKREEPGLSALEIADKITKQCAAQVPEALIAVFPPPPVRGVGRTGGFKLMVEDRESLGLTALQQQTDNLAEAGRKLTRPLPGLDELSAEERVLAEKQRTCPVSGTLLGARGTPLKIQVQGRTVFLAAEEYREEFDKNPEPYLKQLREAPPLLKILPNVFRANAPQLYEDVNRIQCETLGVTLGELFNTLQVYLGSLYVNDFNLFGRTWQVVVQADANHRNQIDAARQLKVRNSAGGMVPVGAVAEVREVNGPLILTRYNMRTAAAINGEPTVGVSSRQAIDLMAQRADRELASGMKYEWTELAFLELQAGNTAMIIFGLAVVMVFLVLAAQYESWSLPLAVILVVPMCLLSSITGVTAVPLTLAYLEKALQQQLHLTTRLAGTNVQMDINIFTQIGFVVLVGLASKNAILIVEFAKRQREAGIARRDATLAACKLRLRPIVMTSFAFILGVVPLLIANGAGAEMRRTLGTAVFSGMLGVTLFGIFLTPVFFSVIDWLGSTRLFHSRGVQMASNIVLIILTFGWLRVLIQLLARRRGSPNPSEPLDEVEEEGEENKDEER